MNKIIPLQSLRGILSVLVAIVHFTPYPNLLLHNHYLAGVAVIFFFILSGYILTAVYFEKQNKLKHFFIFVKKRFLRMYPLHLFFLISFLIIELIKYFFQIYFNFNSNIPIFSNNNYYSFISNFFFVNALNGYLSFNLPSWAASAEFISSIIFGIFLLFSRYIFLIFSLLFFILTWFLFFNQDDGYIVYSGYFTLLACLSCYFLGAITYFLSNNNSIVRFLQNNYLQIINFIIFLIFIKIKINTSLIVFNIAIILIYLINLDKKNYFYDLLCKKFLVSLGNISYSIYLSHFLIFWVITQIFRHILKIESIDSFSTGEIELSIYLIKFFLSFLITIIVSKYTHKHVEMKYRVKKNY